MGTLVQTVLILTLVFWKIKVDNDLNDRGERRFQQQLAGKFSRCSKHIVLYKHIKKRRTAAGSNVCSSNHDPQLLRRECEVYE